MTIGFFGLLGAFLIVSLLGALVRSDGHILFHGGRASPPDHRD